MYTFPGFQDFQLQIFSKTGAKIQAGLLKLPNGSSCIPIINDSLFFNENDLYFGSLSEQKVIGLQEQIAKKRQAYEEFIRRKGRRKNGDIYASFQPFNEASKAFYPFVVPLRKRLPKGGVIVNLWDRGAWFSGLLPGLFPEQKVYITWEGDRNVLGYAGYDFWFADHQNPEYFQLIYCDHNQPLPFDDHSVDLLFAIDAFHRFDQSMWMREALRILKPEGTLVFPHNHLTNNEPDPFFERGCKQMHGRDYQAFFDALLPEEGRRGVVLSEPTLFWFNDKKPTDTLPIVSTPEMDDYNATLAILPQDWGDTPLQPLDFEQLGGDLANYFPVLNGLLTLDLAQQKVRIDRNKIDGQVGYLLDRHPIYVDRLEGTDGLSLTELETKFLFLAEQPFTLGAIAKKLSTTVAALLPSLRRLVAQDVLLVLPLAQPHAHLQSFLSTQDYVIPHQEQTLRALWQRALRFYPDQPALESEADESLFSYAEANEVVEVFANRLLEIGVQKGDRLVLFGPPHLEQLLFVWAGMQIGAVLVPLSKQISAADIALILEEVAPSAVLVAPSLLSMIPDGFPDDRIILLDMEEEPAVDRGTYCAEWAEEVQTEGQAHWPVVAPTDSGVILYTSGSTGRPKGVLLQQGQLFRSARLVTETFEWLGSDRFLVMSGLDSMSGFRNACLAPLEVGACVVIPAQERQGNTFALADIIGERSITTVSATPPFYRQLLEFSQRLKGQLTTLRLAMCTGSALHQDLREGFKDAFGVSLLNYYGLTETSGICIAEFPHATIQHPGSIGWPVQAIAQVVDEQGQPVPPGTTGELRIYSLNLLETYWQRPEWLPAIIQDGWLYTGDLAQLNADHSLSLVGRKRDIIKISTGDLIFPSEIEQALLQLPGIQEAAVCRYLEKDAEKMAAFIVSTGTADVVQLRLLMQERLGSNKVPDKFIQLDYFPLNKNGKIDKKSLVASIQ